VCNAGIALSGFGTDVAQQTLAVNFHGTVALTEALLPSLAPEANIVMVSSGMGELSAYPEALRRRWEVRELDRDRLVDLVDTFVRAVDEGTHAEQGWPTTALNVYTRLRAPALGRGLKLNAVCPGWVRTDMGGNSAPRSVEQGARGIVWAATLPADGPTGRFFRDGRPLDW
jgi:carbonyl reductase 1